MKKIFLKDGEVLEVSDREADGVSSAWSAMRPVTISRLQISLSPFEIKSIRPVENQIKFGKPFLLFSSDKKFFLSGRYFVEEENDAVIKFSSAMNEGKKIIGKFSELKDRLILEDDQVDKEGEEERQRNIFSEIKFQNMLPKKQK